MSGYDRRITPARPDLAAASLKGQVHADRFVEGRPMQVACGVTGLHAAPSNSAGLETQLLYGEVFTIYEEKDSWAWGQAGLDAYVGYASAEAFTAPVPATHRVTARSTPLFVAPDVKKGASDTLPMNAKLIVAETDGRFARLADGRFVFGGHIAPLSEHAADWVAVAERFLGVPYLWGGKTFRGIDCSGLIQTALEAGGIASPRDTDMMEASLGRALPPESGLRRGDLVFWKGHAGVMLDGERLLHANAHFMEVTAESFSNVRDRILARENQPVRTIKRL